MIRDGKELDIDDIVRMSHDFWRHTIYDEPSQDQDIHDMAARCIEDGLCSVFEKDGSCHGFICGIKGPLMANFDVLCGTELAWWVDEEYRNTGAGINLLRDIQEKAKNQGVKYWNMVYMASSMPESIKKIYESMGYVRNETIYTRTL